MRKASAIELDDAQREKLVKLAQSNTTEVRLARRASTVLLAADGRDNYRIGEMLGVGGIQAGRWRERYAVGGGPDAISGQALSSEAFGLRYLPGSPKRAR